MHFTTITTTALCLLSAFVPLAFAAPSAKKADPKPMVPAGKTTCVGTNEALFSDYKVYLDTTTGITNAAELCGGNGIKKHLKHQCGLGVTKFHCEVQNGRVAVAFRIPETCSRGKVTKGLWESTTPNFQGLVTCTDKMDPKVWDIVKQVLEQLAKILAEMIK